MSRLSIMLQRSMEALLPIDLARGGNALLYRSAEEGLPLSTMDAIPSSSGREGLDQGCLGGYPLIRPDDKGFRAHY